MRETPKSSKTKFFLSFLFIMAAGIAGYYYFAPFKSFADNLGTQMNAALILAIDGTKEQVRNLVTSNILPKNPADQREVLMKKLQSNLDQLKTKISATNASIDNNLVNEANSGADSGSNSVSGLINNSQQLITQLQAVNQNGSVAQNVANRVLDVVLPMKENAVSCQTTPAN